MPTRSPKRAAKPERGITTMARWKLEDAKARFSEVVRLASTAGPQLVTIRGREAAVIIAPDHYERLLPKSKDRVPLVRFLQSLDWDGLGVERGHDTGREIDL
jgi:antitoxin Phd